MTLAQRENGSFRDPSGSIWKHNGRIFRTVKGAACEGFKKTEASGLFEHTFKHGKLIDTRIIEDKSISNQIEDDFELLLEHSKIPLVNYPYEWSFEQLKDAALFHLEILSEALERNIMLSDASAYNVQFIGPTPYFIDILSFRPYREGEVWDGYKQFCEQFFYPLLLQCELGVAFNNWFKGTLEGISAHDLNQLMPLRKKLKPRIFSHLVLPALLQKNAEKPNIQKRADKNTRASLPKTHLKGIFASLTSAIQKLVPDGQKKSVWSDYEDNNSYSDGETTAKKTFIQGVMQQVKPATVWDMGCNTGQFAQICLEAGVADTVGFDFDLKTVGIAYRRAKAKSLKFTALHQDLANPSPAHGWNGAERHNLKSRANAEFTIALALVHHIAIGRNVPLEYFAEWLVSLAPEGIVEFVPKDDPMVQELLKNREDIFPSYTLENFLLHLKKLATIEAVETITAEGRTLIHFSRRAN